MKRDFIINDCGVCVNPIIIYHNQKPNTLAWNYVELSIAKFPNGKWGFGCSHLGGGFAPVNITAKYNSKEEAELEAKNYIKRKLSFSIENYSNSFCVKKEDYKYYLSQFLEWESSQKQLTLF